MSTVLVIEDSAHVRALLVTVLQREGYMVVGVASARLAMDAWRERVFDLVITDILMPEQDGLETITALHRERPTVPIIAITGGGGPSNFLALARRLGAVRTIHKPFDVPVLVEAVRALVPPGPAPPGGQPE